MAMKRSNQPGGGLASKALTPAVNVYFGGRPSSKVNPGGVDQLGQQMSNDSTDGGRVLPNPGTPMCIDGLYRTDL
jgi:hypothetical protein